jgi:catechol 2,3-dioxygenase-like lactoylglutathione lyase family enzyme
MQAPRIAGVYETVVYGPDVQALVSFYGDILGLRLVDEMAELGATFRLADGSTLLVFDPRRAAVPGRAVPSHGTSGSGHVAFAIEEGERKRWVAYLQDRGVAIESELTWGSGGISIYVRDPAGNSVELVDGEVWPL